MNPNAKTFTPKASTPVQKLSYDSPTFKPQTGLTYNDTQFTNPYSAPSQNQQTTNPNTFFPQNQQTTNPFNFEPLFSQNLPATNYQFQQYQQFSTPYSLPSYPTPSTPSNSTDIPPTPLELLSTIFPDLEASILQEALRTHESNLSAAVLTLSKKSDLSSQGILDEIYNDQFEEDGEEEKVEGVKKADGVAENVERPKKEISESKQQNTQPNTKPNHTKTNANIQNTKPPPNTKSSINSSKPKNKPTATKSASKEEQQVCKYFLLGQCLRKDCMFLHTDRVICKYWKLGTCSRGDTCIYMHAEEPKLSLPSKPTPTPPKPAPPKVEDVRKEDTNQEKKELTNTPMRRMPLTLDMASNVKLKQLQALFHHIEDKVVRDTFFANKFDTAATTEFLSRIHGKPRKVEPVAAPVVQKEVTARRAPKRWVETGEAVDALYTQYRQEAIEHATIRNSCFHFATSAYLAGDGLAAKEWSKRGRYHDEMMQQLHREACMKILETRNKDLYADMMLDLHGLHKKEAIEILSTKIDFLKKSNASRSGERIHAIYVLVGTGHHSFSGTYSSLAKAVRSYLDDNRIRYTDCSDRGGMLTVYIK